MLRQPGSKYVRSRSSTLLKVKSFADDEAIITGYVAGKGKYAGQAGSLKCALPNGKTFNCGSGLTDALRSNPPKKGQIITFKYQELTDCTLCCCVLFGFIRSTLVVVLSWHSALPRLPARSDRCHQERLRQVQGRQDRLIDWTHDNAAFDCDLLF